MCYYSEAWYITGFKPTDSQQEFFCSLLPQFWGLLFHKRNFFLFLCLLGLFFFLFVWVVFFCCLLVFVGFFFLPELSVFLLGIFKLWGFSVQEASTDLFLERILGCINPHVRNVAGSPKSIPTTGILGLLVHCFSALFLSCVWTLSLAPCTWGITTHETILNRFSLTSSV